MTTSVPVAAQRQEQLERIRRYKRWVFPAPVLGSLAKRRIKAANHAARRTNVCVLHVGRVGSTVLAKMLEAHPSVFWGHEIFHHMPPRHAKAARRPAEVQAFLDDAMHLYAGAVYGFEVQVLPSQHVSPAIINMPLPELVPFLEANGASNFIFIGRRNYLRRAASAAAGRARGAWHHAGGQAATQTVRIDPDNFQIMYAYYDLLEFFDVMRRTEDQVESLLANRRSLLLSYEDDIESDPLACYRRICAFLDIPPGEPEVPLARANPRPLAEIVENFDEIASRLAGTDHAWMLDS